MPFLLLLCLSVVLAQDNEGLYEEMMNDAEFQKILKLFPQEEKAVPQMREDPGTLSLDQRLRQRQTEENERNRDTIGYKRREYDFHIPYEQPLRHLSVGLKIDMRQGELRPTGEDFDLAIEGKGFFRVIDQETLQILYTRCGSFERDTEGFLALIQGERVFRLAPEIFVPEELDSFQISEVGQITGEQMIGRLELVLFPNPKRLRPIDDRCFSETSLSGKPKTQGKIGKIRQGFLEESNVFPVNPRLCSCFSRWQGYNTNEEQVRNFLPIYR